MPVYEYVCHKCGATTEALRKMAQADDAIACAQCGSEKTQRAHSVFSPSSGGAEAPPMSPCGQCAQNGACPMQ